MSSKIDLAVAESGPRSPDLNDLVELAIVQEVDDEGNPLGAPGENIDGNGDNGIMEEERLDIESGDAETAGGESEPGTGEAAAEPDAVESPAEPETAESSAEELDRLREDLLRVQADFINFRKRMEREKNDVIRRANQALIEELLPVIDNFELALANNGQQADGDTYGEGVRLIHKQLLDLLAKHGLREMSCVGDAFDPNIHEAVAVVSDPEKENNTIVAELKKGYYLRDRLIRSPLVQVVINEENGGADGEEQAGPGETAD